MNTVVYQWVREDRTPYYIGIGNPRRPYTGRRRCGRPPSRDRIIILHENLEWEEACRIEKELIAFYGRVDLGTGILRNLTDGGEGVVNPSKETREKISRENHYSFGKPLSKETREKLSKSLSGENHYNFGKSLSKETREKISKSMSGENNHMFGKSLSKETREKISRSLSGKNSPLFGKSLSEETRKKRFKPKNWYHPDHGKILQKSCTEMVELFPEQNLSTGNLSNVARGVRSHHKGWIALKA